MKSKLYIIDFYKNGEESDRDVEWLWSDGNEQDAFDELKASDEVFENIEMYEVYVVREAINEDELESFKYKK